MNATTLKLAFGLVLSTLTVRELSAQWNVARSADQREFGYASLALDGAVIALVGYVRTVSALGRDWQMGAEGGIVAAGWAARDFRGRAEVRTSLVHLGALRVVGRAAFNAGSIDNPLHRALNFGSTFTGAAGLYRRGWFLAGEAGLDKGIASHIAHSDWYRRNVDANAHNGWHMSGGGSFHYGMTGGLAVGRTEIAARGGWRGTDKYATGSVGFRF